MMCALLSGIIIKPEKEYLPPSPEEVKHNTRKRTRSCTNEVNISSINKVQNMKRINKILDCFYACLYNYSHKKLETLIKCKEFCVFFVDFYESGKFEYMIRNDNTMRKSRDSYIKAVKELVNATKLAKVD
jgi:hypothetical protein